VQRIEPSGYYYTNMIVRFTLEAMEEVMGRNGLNAILNLAGLSHLIDNYPPANVKKEFDFADFSVLMGALEEMYGARGGRGLQLRAGRVGFARGGQKMGAMVGSDQKSTVEDRGEYYAYIMNPCPVCWGRTADRPICYAGKGLVEEALHWVSGGLKFRVEEIECKAMGDETCTYAIYKEPIG